MRIGGFQKLSLLDYPGKLSAIIFTLGCNFRCPFCYVPHLVLHNRMLRQLISDGLVDYVEMDLKAPLEFNKYNRAVGGVLTEEIFKNIRESVKMLLTSSIDYEFRTTLVKELHTKEDILEICRSIKGARRYYLQNFRRTGLYVGGKELTPFKEKEIKEILEAGRRFVNITYRG